MFGSKLRSWMEAVRPKRKQHKKDKQIKCNSTFSSGPNTPKCYTQNHNNKYMDKTNDTIMDLQNKNQTNQPDVTNSNSNNHSRYSANNLSSPESAYSTGYSTDGTSPGAGAPPDYLNMNTITTAKEVQYYTDYAKKVVLPSSPTACITNNNSNTINNPTNTPTGIPRSKLTPNIAKDRRAPSIPMTQECNSDTRVISAQTRSTILHGGSPALGITSPRQRNRIRTNPWLPGSTPSPALNRHDILKTPVKSTNRSIMESPRPRNFLSPASRRRSLSSSSCSSLSGASLHWEPTKHRSIKSVSDEDDCTLNEMMGKYDESYVYEKETDILSDSDPTDCETDIDTGQDGGDEDDPLEVELDFIDNGSYVEFEQKLDHNTGHCSYYNYDVQRKCSSRRRATRRNKQQSDKRRRSSSNKKRHKQFDIDLKRKINTTHLDGSKSAGATPVSVRRANSRPISKLALDDCLKKRSNSLSFHRDQITTIDKRDKEADLKYKELIVEAEHILRTMKTNGLSPRRVPGPANKRVELLRTTECTKPELFINKNRSVTNDDNTTYNKIPPSNYNCPRFSPKKNHITNFIISNSPILVKREWEMQAQNYNSPLAVRKKVEIDETTQCVQQKTIKGQTKTPDNKRPSPKYRKKVLKQPQYRNTNSSSESDTENKLKTSNLGCPQSEPVRRKVYLGQGQGKTVAFNLSSHDNNNKGNHFDYFTTSTENLRQQVLLNTIANLKRNLEDQSASLKQVYKSSQNIHV